MAANMYVEYGCGQILQTKAKNNKIITQQTNHSNLPQNWNTEHMYDAKIYCFRYRKQSDLGLAPKPSDRPVQRLERTSPRRPNQVEVG